MKLKSKIRKIAKEAGFIFWDDAEWGPGPGHIDWSCDYDEELAKFAEILEQKLRKKIIKQIKDYNDDATFWEDNDTDYMHGHNDAILDVLEIVETNGKGYGYESDEDRS